MTQTIGEKIEDVLDDLTHILAVDVGTVEDRDDQLHYRRCIAQAMRDLIPTRYHKLMERPQ